MITQLVLNLFRSILFIFIINVILISTNRNPCHPIEKSFSELDGASQVVFLQMMNVARYQQWDTIELEPVN